MPFSLARLSLLGLTLAACREPPRPPPEPPRTPPSESEIAGAALAAIAAAPWDKDPTGWGTLSPPRRRSATRWWWSTPCDAARPGPGILRARAAWMLATITPSRSPRPPPGPGNGARLMWGGGPPARPAPSCATPTHARVGKLPTSLVVLRGLEEVAWPDQNDDRSSLLVATPARRPELH